MLKKRDKNVWNKVDLVFYIEKCKGPVYQYSQVDWFLFSIVPLYFFKTKSGSTKITSSIHIFIYWRCGLDLDSPDNKALKLLQAQ